MSNALQEQLDRLESIQVQLDPGEYWGWHQALNDAWLATENALVKAGTAADQITALPGNVLDCKAFGHAFQSWKIIGRSVAGLYGMVYESQCSSCGSTGRRARNERTGRSQGSNLIWNNAEYQVKPDTRMYPRDYVTVKLWEDVCRAFGIFEDMKKQISKQTVKPGHIRLVS